ncbi:hypothetical protein VTP01DRAFT_6335 [Rhizomucor pusillus]|uniref:uncharacterized protein n=1 Tax=Rhizomucor pusillus TaxID=4840 RepID=UPI0037443C9A
MPTFLQLPFVEPVLATMVHSTTLAGTVAPQDAEEVVEVAVAVAASIIAYIYPYSIVRLDLNAISKQKKANFFLDHFKAALVLQH